MNKYYVNNKKNTPEEIMERGSKLEARVTKIKKTLRGYVVTCIVERDELWEGREFVSPPYKEEPRVDVGSLVDLFIDDVDTDGEFFIKIS